MDEKREADRSFLVFFIFRLIGIQEITTCFRKILQGISCRVKIILHNSYTLHVQFVRELKSIFFQRKDTFR